MNQNSAIARCARLVVGVLALGMGVVANAVEGADEVARSVEADGSSIIARLRELRPDLPIEGVRPAPIPGMFGVELAGGQILYVTSDARYMIAGDLFELGSEELINLAEQQRIVKRRELMATVAEDEELVFSPEGVTRTSISVFTDVDCGYCRKLHLEVPAMNAMGIEVRYLAYPRAGIGSASYDKIVTAWCSDDRNDALTRLKRGEELASVTCDNPVARQFLLGRKVGVTGTPAIVLPDGQLLPGYLPADELAKALGIEPS
jgi:thiol:disulfide interchange protein DsbC